MRPDRRQTRRTTRLAALLAAVLLVALPAPAPAFDTGPHSDITRDAMVTEGFGGTASDVAVVSNWLVDLYSNSSKIPQSGHAKTSVEVLGSLFGPRENWPKAVLEGAGRMHFDSQIWDVFDVHQARREWERLQRATTQAIRSVKANTAANRAPQLLTVIGITLHSLQDFYSHSNWIEKQGVRGVDGTDWSKLTVGHTPTWFDVPAATRDTLNVYIGDSTFHKERPHGAWNTDKNESMVKGVNKDWPGRLGYEGAYTTAYFATRQWLRALRVAVGDEALWAQAQRYADQRGSELAHDLRGALKIGMMTGHWQGQGEPCDPSFSLNICGSRNGLGGDLIGARNAIRDYFDRSRTRFRTHFQSLIPLFGQVKPTGDLFAVESSQPQQAAIRFVHVRVTSMKGVGLRALGDPTPIDRADMFSRATVAGQSFQSGEINGRDSFSFPLPYAPFAFIKAIPAGGRYPEPVTSMTVEIRTSSSAFAGTDDDVYLRVAPGLRFALDKRLYDDFERGDRDTYSVPIDAALHAGLSVGDLDRVQVEKSPDGVAGGWKLRGVKLTVNGRVLYAREGIERWLEKNRRTWRAPDFRPSDPTGAALPITLDLWDEDSFVYGGSDQGDIEPYDRRKRLALAYTPDTVVRARVTGGSRHGGRLGDGDKASVTYVIVTLTPTIAPPPLNAPPPPVVIAPPPDPPPPAAKPDLVISAMGYSDADKWFFTVKNQGAGAAKPFSVSVTGTPGTTYAIPGLAPGESATRTFREQCQVITNVATADALGEVSETDETNNERSFTNDFCGF